MTPEQRFRRQIDRQLEQSGEFVQDHQEMNISASMGGFLLAAYQSVIDRHKDLDRDQKKHLRTKFAKG